MKDIVKFTKRDILEYVNSAIINWRERKESSLQQLKKGVLGKKAYGEDKLIAQCYIDAFQSVRISIFGKTLPLKVKDLKYCDDVVDVLDEKFDIPEEGKDCGSNAGIKCDVGDGPCACGAWHKGKKDE